MAPESTIAALRDAAGDSAGVEFLRVAGEAVTFADTYDLTARVADGLRALGIEPGDRVAIMTGNCLESVTTWFAANAIGAIDLPVNTQARGRSLSYLIGDAAPRVIVAGAEQIDALVAAGAAPEFAVLVGAEGDGRPFGRGTSHLEFGELADAASDRAEHAPAPDAVASLIYTSGTTGPSKGVMVPQAHWPDQGELLRAGLGLGRGEVIYTAQPLFHQDARTFVQIALAARATAAMAERFSVSGFWDDIRRHEANVFGCIGTMMWLLYKQQPSEDDAAQPARIAGSAAVPPEIHRAFEQRFGVEVHQWYGQTETGCVTYTLEHGSRPGSIGRATPSFDVKVVDDGDREVAPGEIGELCCRPKQANVLMRGYWQQPDATIEAWRNLWFHTGDLVRQAEDGEHEFVGRKKDAIRRRGENISAWEVEQAATRHDEVLEAAAFGVPSPLGEEDVAMLVVAGAAGALAPRDLHEFMSESLPAFAVPRFIEFVDELPKTPSERIEKAKVRERGVTDAAWDAEVAR